MLNLTLNLWKRKLTYPLIFTCCLCAVTCPQAKANDAIDSQDSASFLDSSAIPPKPPRTPPLLSLPPVLPIAPFQPPLPVPSDPIDDLPTEPPEGVPEPSLILGLASSSLLMLFRKRNRASH